MIPRRRPVSLGGKAWMPRSCCCYDVGVASTPYVRCLRAPRRLGIGAEATRGNTACPANHISLAAC